MYRLLVGAVLAALMSWPAARVAADSKQDAFLDLARRGWVYELRTTMVGRDLSIPVSINGRDLAGASLCLVGERPREATREVLTAFRALMYEAHGKPVPMRFAGPTARLCGAGRVVVLRLFSNRPPNAALTDDLTWMNAVHQLGLPQGRVYAAASPAMAQTFFGRRGSGTHIMVKQPGSDSLSPLERDFYRSILIEELYQSFTFGMDILHLDRSAPYLSKLEEFPVDLTRMPWDSRAFMRGLLGSNPRGLCEFDVFMLHAVATSDVAQTTEAAFLDDIRRRWPELIERTAASMADARFAPILDADCRGETPPASEKG
ncbi:hypothetical protein SAMN05444413_11461 [Roseivivax marinus]|uniref:hypothetical protein n=1 Tax=Roseivivax marinus TaxID=1379903 RepID=UPI0008BD44BE|nr:hypothetical protein [Roseivivax marinus]SEL71637.1 hypothetical protein SAMN05444413_11461 [Roseivivax marinus]